MSTVNNKFSRVAIIVLYILDVYLFYCISFINFNERPSYNRPSLRLIDAYQSQVKERRNNLNLISQPDLDQRFQWGHLYNNLAPEVYCAEKIKVGTTGDGGKWMCSPFNLPDGCTIFALGISNSITFEVHLQRITKQRCQIVSVDSDEQTDATKAALKDVRASATKALIGAMDNEKTRTMESILLEKGVDHVEILKIDIEGAELEAMEPFLNKFTVSQIMIEIHGKTTDTVKLLKMFSSKGYLLYHYEINGIYHELCEYGFIHESRLQRYQATYMAKYL